MKTKIVIAGIGGVGGYFGGHLSKAFSESTEVEIYFLARGNHLKEIQAKGLTIIQGETSFTTKPTSATDNAEEIGIADYIILCTKSYDLENTVKQLLPCISENTTLLPLLNGVDSVERIKNICSNTNVINGCVYIVSLIKEYGVVENIGNIQTLYFGQDIEANEKLQQLEKIFKQANIEATLTKNISSFVWEKFHLVGANSTATSYFKCSTGEILSDETKKEFLLSLLKEVNQIALSNNITFDKELVSATMEKLQSLPYETTSSMQRDFLKPNPKTELETITGFIVREGLRLGIPTPSFNIAYNALLK